MSESGPKIIRVKKRPFIEEDPETAEAFREGGL